MALKIRNTITLGMDNIWRERNSAQHQPKDRKEINNKITAAFESRERLGIDSSPHTCAEDLHKLPFRTKANWLANSETRIQEQVENNKRKTAAAKAFSEGKSPAWNKDADKGRPQKRTQQKRLNPHKGNNKGKQAQPTVRSPWDNSPMAAPRGSQASAKGAQPAAATAAGAAAAAAAAAAATAATTTIAATARGAGRLAPLARPSTAGIATAPSSDPKRNPHSSRGTRSDPVRKRTDTTQNTAPKTDNPAPPTLNQDDDPDRIDDVV